MADSSFLATEHQLSQPHPRPSSCDLKADAISDEDILQSDESGLNIQKDAGHNLNISQFDPSQDDHKRLHPSVRNSCGVDHVNTLNLKTAGHPSRIQEVIPALLPPTPPPEPAMNTARLFVASLGNPPPYSLTRHSAGHTLIKALQSHLSLPSFLKSKSYANGLTSIGAGIGRPEYTLWQSPSLMNTSGVALLKAYKTHIATAQESSTDPLPGLVILYDEMETAPAQLKVRRGATSAKGHNGIKSVQQSLESAGLMSKMGDRFVKIGIGIGRPANGSRSPDDVSRYVLAQLNADEKRGIEDKVSDLERLLELEMVRMSK